MSNTNQSLCDDPFRETRHIAQAINGLTCSREVLVRISVDVTDNFNEVSQSHRTNIRISLPYKFIIFICDCNMKRWTMYIQ
jgi:hypothetical protein